MNATHLASTSFTVILILWCWPTFLMHAQASEDATTSGRSWPGAVHLQENKQEHNHYPLQEYHTPLSTWEVVDCQVCTNVKCPLSNQYWLQRVSSIYNAIELESFSGFSNTFELKKTQDCHVHSLQTIISISWSVSLSLYLSKQPVLQSQIAQQTALHLVLLALPTSPPPPCFSCVTIATTLLFFFYSIVTAPQVERKWWLECRW